MAAEALAALTLLIWCYLLLMRGGYWRMRDASIGRPAPQPAPSVVAVIPARNEAGLIERAVASLAAQDYRGPFHIIVVDDASSDGTAGRARLAAQPSILTVAPAPPLEPGWSGKLSAVAEGIRLAGQFDPKWILLTDADIEHPPYAVSSLVERAQSEGRDLVSYMVALETGTLAERALIPAFVYFFFMLYPPAWIADRRRKMAGAAGGSILIAREALSRIGGIEAIRGELIDDCALARAVKRSGGSIWLGLAARSRSLRSYGSFGEIAQMISRTAFTQLDHSLPLLLGTVLGLLLVFVAPPVLSLEAKDPTTAGLASLAWLLMALSYLPVLRYYRKSPLWAPFLPCMAAFYLAATVQSAIDYWRGAGGMWKGRAQDPLD
jgi:hopene-associated glycosyltransferase HpnB